MARIVPARPLPAATEARHAAVLALESGLGDDHLVLQNWDGGILVLRADRTACHLIPVDRQPAPSRAVAMGKTGVQLRLEGQSGRELVAQVRDIMSGKGDLMQVEEIESVLDEASPGGTPYAGGGISPAQMAWRSERSIEPTASLSLSTPIVALLRNAAENVVQDDPVWIQGVRTDAEAIASPRSLLPATVVAAALVWGPVVASAEGAGGFRIRLRRDRTAACGYVVTGLECSAPLLLLLPFMDVIRRAHGPKGFVLDKCYGDFVSWLERRGHDTEGAEDIDIALLEEMTDE